MKICSTCSHIFEHNLPVDTCPINECSGNLMKVEDTLADAVSKLLRLGVSISEPHWGHLHKEFFRCHISVHEICPHWYDFNLKHLREIIDEISSKYPNMKIGFGSDGGYCNTIEIYCLSGVKDPRERINLQVEFLSFLYDLIDRLGEEIIDDQEDLSTSEN